MKLKWLVLALGATLGAAAIAADATSDKPAGPGEKLFAKIDTGGDGVLIFDEFVAAKLIRAGRQFDRLDGDDDGTITLDEVDAARQWRFGDVDRDALRACVQGHFKRELPELPEPGARFAEADADGNGELTRSEFEAAKTAAAAEQFALLDVDGSATLDKSEMRAAGKTIRKLRRVTRSCVEDLATDDALLAEDRL